MALNYRVSKKLVAKRNLIFLRTKNNRENIRGSYIMATFAVINIQGTDHAAQISITVTVDLMVIAMDIKINTA